MWGALFSLLVIVVAAGLWLRNGGGEDTPSGEGPDGAADDPAGEAAGVAGREPAEAAPPLSDLPEGAAGEWIPPEYDESVAENPEDYGIDGGGAGEPMWTPPEPAARAEPSAGRRKAQSFPLAACRLWSRLRLYFDALYALWYALKVISPEKTRFGPPIPPEVPVGAEGILALAAALALLGAAVLALYRARSALARPFFLIYMLIDIFTRALNLWSGALIGGEAIATAITGATVALSLDAACAAGLISSKGARVELE